MPELELLMLPEAYDHMIQFDVLGIPRMENIRIDVWNFEPI